MPAVQQQCRHQTEPGRRRGRLESQAKTAAGLRSGAATWGGTEGEPNKRVRAVDRGARAAPSPCRRRTPRRRQERTGRANARRDRTSASSRCRSPRRQRHQWPSGGTRSWLRSASCWLAATRRGGARDAAPRTAGRPPTPCGARQQAASRRTAGAANKTKRERERERKSKRKRKRETARRQRARRRPGPGARRPTCSLAAVGKSKEITFERNELKCSMASGKGRTPAVTERADTS